MSIDLSSKQRSHLKSLAHELNPVVHIGKDGVTEAVVETTEEVFKNRELIKVKVLKGAPEGTRGSGEELAQQTDGAQVVHVVGRIVVLYRPDPENPKIQLPS